MAERARVSHLGALLRFVRCTCLGAADLGEIGSRFATERKSQRDAETPGLPGASESLLVETAPTAQTRQCGRPRVALSQLSFQELRSERLSGPTRAPLRARGPRPPRTSGSLRDVREAGEAPLAGQSRDHREEALG